MSHLLALFFYAAKKSELHSNKKKAVADDEPRYKSYHAGKRSRTLILVKINNFDL